MTETINTGNLRCVWDGKAKLSEGVVSHEAERLVYWVDILRSNLHRLSVDGTTHRWHIPGQLSAVVPCQGGGLLDTFEDGLSHIDLETASVSRLAPNESEMPDNRFNDGCTDLRRQFWFGSMDSNEREVRGGF